MHIGAERDVETGWIGVFHLSLLSSKVPPLCPWGLRGRCCLSLDMWQETEGQPSPLSPGLIAVACFMFARFPCKGSGLLNRDAATPIPPGTRGFVLCRASLVTLGGRGYPQPVPHAPVLPSYSTAGLSAAASQATPSWVLLISFFYKSHSLIMVNNESLFPDLCSFYPNCILTSICIFDPSHDGKKTLSCSDRIKKKVRFKSISRWSLSCRPLGNLPITVSLFSAPPLGWTLTASQAVAIKRGSEEASCLCCLIATRQNSYDARFYDIWG